MMNRFLAVTALIVGLVLVPAADAAKRHPKPPPAHTIIVTSYRAQLMAPEGSLRAAWVQYGPGGGVEARAVVEGDACPLLFLDLRESVMKLRAAAGSGFAAVCQAEIPAGTRQAALAFHRLNTPPPPEVGASGNTLREWLAKETGIAVPPDNARQEDWQAWLAQVSAQVKYDVVPLPLSVADPQRIVVFGDTGCRIKGTALQDCSNPDEWPFARIAAEAAKLRPDLVIHVGDYLYRENACPANFPGCQGSPWGDNWPTWDADFFTPAKPLLAAAPWVIVRGNHEECSRAGPGWLRLLGPAAFDPAADCAVHLPPYTIPLAALNLIVMDDADAPETSVTSEVPVYKNELASLAEAKAPVWFILHRPIWAAISGPLGIPAGGNQTLIAAAGRDGISSPVELMLSGHIHTFEAINYRKDDHVPPQIVAGFGGDMLDPTPISLRGTIFQGDSGVRVADGLSIGGFGFLLLTRVEDGWTIDVHDGHGRVERRCVFRAARVDCPPQRQAPQRQ